MEGKPFTCMENSTNENPIHKHNTADCFVKIVEPYWFYLSFENSICQDYITEKFWRTLELETVPVVMGGGNYLRDAPEMVVCSYLIIFEKDTTSYY